MAYPMPGTQIMNTVVNFFKAHPAGYLGFSLERAVLCDRHMKRADKSMVVGQSTDTCHHCSIEWDQAWQFLISHNYWLGEINDSMVIYISGPMSNMPDHNHKAFYMMEHALKLRGAAVLNPCDHDAPNQPYHILLRIATQKLVDSATHVVMLRQWRISSGAQFEHEVAQRLCIPIFYETSHVVIDDVPPKYPVSKAHKKSKGR